MKATLAFFGLATIVALAPAAALAGPNLVANGGFETTTHGPGQLGFNTAAPGWSAPGYAVIFGAGTADTTGITDFAGNLQLWGPNNGQANGLTAASPSGGNFLAVDSAFGGLPDHPGNMAITQTLTGLTEGGLYTVSFDWAGAEQEGFDRKSHEQWIVGFGDSTQSTAVVSVPRRGFSGWMHESFTFRADGASQVLSFLANGGPSAAPPYALLDSVSVEAVLSGVPEPASWALMILGFGVTGAAIRRRRSVTAV